MRPALLLGLLSTLSVPASAHALASVIVGNQPLGSGFAFGAEVLAAVNTEERVYLYNHDGNLFFYFKGGPKALNVALRWFAAIPAERREIILLPVPAKPLVHDKKPIAYDWCLHVPAEQHYRVFSEVADARATLTIYIPELLPPALADPRTARAWIADLGSDDFKTRERAAKDLAALGPPVAALLREALNGRVSPEARERMERILAGVSTDIRLDVLEFPEKVPVLGLEGLLERARTELANKNPIVRGDAVTYLASYAAPADEILPDLEKVLKTETHKDPIAAAAWAALRLGAAGRLLVPTLRETAKTADKNVASICEQAIDKIEKATAESVPEADARKRATIRKEIREYVAGLTKARK